MAMCRFCLETDIHGLNQQSCFWIVPNSLRNSPVASQKEGSVRIASGPPANHGSLIAEDFSIPNESKGVNAHQDGA